MTLFFYIIFALLGALVGSLLNAYIHRECHNERTGAKESLMFPKRSYCPECRSQIAWYDNIPIFSFLFLRGRCRSCGKSISKRYLLVELMTSGLSVFLYHLFYVTRHEGVLLGASLLVTFALIAIVFIDLDVMIIPDNLSLNGIVVGILYSTVLPSLHGVQGDLGIFMTHWLGFKSSLYGMLCGGGVIFLIGFVGTWIFKKEAMGGGDLKMMAMLGAFLGWSSIWLIIFVGSLVGTLVAIGPLVMGKKKLSDEIPFGPFLAVGAFVVLCWKDIIYQGLFFR